MVGAPRAEVVMRRLYSATIVALASFLFLGSALAVENPVPGSQQANIHNPFSPGYKPLRPNQYRPQPSPGTPPPPQSGGTPVVIWWPWYGWN
jgi:hypothetical protein